VFVTCCVGSGPWDELISRPEEFYRLCLIGCDLEISAMRWSRPERDDVPETKIILNAYIIIFPRVE